MNSKIIMRKPSIEDYTSWCNGFSINLSSQDFEKLLKKMDSQEQQDKSYSFILDEAGDMIGFVQVFNILRYPANSGMIEIAISESKRKLGYGKAAITMLENFCFNELALQRLIAPILPTNDASIGLFTSLNYQRYFTDPSAFFFDGKPVAHEIYVKINSKN